MDDYSYRPFTMDEINGQKGNNLLEKIDEIPNSVIDSVIASDEMKVVSLLAAYCCLSISIISFIFYLKIFI